MKRVLRQTDLELLRTRPGDRNPVGSEKLNIEIWASNEHFSLEMIGFNSGAQGTRYSRAFQTVFREVLQNYFTIYNVYIFCIAYSILATYSLKNLCTSGTRVCGKHHIHIVYQYYTKCVICVTYPLCFEDFSVQPVRTSLWGCANPSTSV